MPYQSSKFDLDEGARDAEDETLCTLPELWAVFGPTMGAQSIFIQVGLSAAIWFLAVMWLNFVGGADVDLAQAVGTGLFVILLTLFLVTVSMAITERRQSEPTHASYLESLPERCSRSMKGGLAPKPDGRLAAAIDKSITTPGHHAALRAFAPSIPTSMSRQ